MPYSGGRCRINICNPIVAIKMHLANLYMQIKVDRTGCRNFDSKLKSGMACQDTFTIRILMPLKCYNLLSKYLMSVRDLCRRRRHLFTHFMEARSKKA